MEVLLCFCFPFSEIKRGEGGNDEEMKKQDRES